MAFTVTNGLCALTDVKAALRLTDTMEDDRLSLAIDASSRLIEATCNRRFYQDPAPRTDASTLNGTSLVIDTSIAVADTGRQVLDPTGHNLIPSGCVVGNVAPGVSYSLVTFEGAPVLALGGGAQNLTIGLTPRYFTAENWDLCVLNDGGESSSDISTSTGLVISTDYAGDGTFGTTWAVNDYQLEPINGIVQGQPGWPFTQIRAIRSLYFPARGMGGYAPPWTQTLVEVVARWGWPAVPSPVTQAAIVQSIATFKSPDAAFGATPFAEAGIVRLKQAMHPTALLLLATYMDDPVLVG
jgi:hypothetical protein